MKADHLSSLLRPGMTVFVQSASGEPTALVEALKSTPDACRGVQFVACQIPGLNRTDFAGLHPEARFTGLFVTPDMVGSHAEGKVRFMPLSYRGMYRYLEHQPIDLALIQVRSSDSGGRFGLGGSVHFVPAVLGHAKTVVAEVNETLPSVGKSVSIDASRLDYLVETSHPLPTLNAGAPSEVARRIGTHVAELVRDGDHVQIGIGKVPSAVLEALGDHRRLSCRGGLVSDAMIDLEAAGTLEAGSPLICTSVIGTERVYGWVTGRKDVHVLPVSQSHDVLALGRLDNFVAINSVLSVDLTGQANAETVEGRQVSGCGGLPEFVRSAALSKGGRSIFVLPSTAGQGKVSRILQKLGDDIVSSPRFDADYVVTEHGVADLRFKSLDERAEALISIADPDFQGALATAWEQYRQGA